MDVLIFVLVLTGVLILVFCVGSDDGSDESLWNNEMYGKYYVRYNDGARSQNFYRSVARDYAEIFGGTVHKVEK